jgi:hypothetical protein
MIDDGRVLLIAGLAALVAVKRFAPSPGSLATARSGRVAWPTEETGLIDRTGWPRGPWDAEPDLVRWIDPKTGLRCVVACSILGNLAGYVEVPQGHVWFGEEPSVPGVHGGVNWSGAKHPYAELGADGWWIGFDCGHLSDVTPGIGNHWPGSEYRTIGYTQDECTKLAAAVAAARGSGSRGVVRQGRSQRRRLLATRPEMLKVVQGTDAWWAMTQKHRLETLDLLDDMDFQELHKYVELLGADAGGIATRRQILKAIHESSAWKMMSLDARARTDRDLKTLDLETLHAFGREAGLEFKRGKLE